jgi:uncharacterized membrane protein (UPF0127 family)
MQQRVIIAFAVTLLTLAGCRADGGPTAVIEGANGSVPVVLEIASTPAALERGLMYRQSLDDGRGMLFIFADETDHSFWMKNTLIPLDMLFIARDGPNAGRIVGIHENATPHSTASISVGKPSTYVLEVPGGWSKRVGVRTGDRITLPRLEPVPAA